jgi:hypothetical protein
MEIRQEQLDQLSDREREELERFLATDKPPLSPNTAVKLYELFLAGHTCEEIQKQNRQFSLGMIVHARIRDDWDGHRQRYLSDLYSQASKRFGQVQLESVNFLADSFAAVHKLNGDKVKRFLQTGDPEDLAGVGFLPSSVKAYKDLWETMLKITGKDKPGVAVSVNNQAPAPGQIATVEAQALPAEGPMQAQDAHTLIKALLAAKSETR